MMLGGDRQSESAKAIEIIIALLKSEERERDKTMAR